MAIIASFTSGCIYVAFDVLPNSSSGSKGNPTPRKEAQIDTGCDYALVIPEAMLGAFPVYNHVVDGAAVYDVQGSLSIHDSYHLDVDWINGRKTIFAVAIAGAPLLAGRPLFADDSELNVDWRSRVAIIS